MFIFILLLLLFGNSAFSIYAPYSLESSQVLPKGIGNGRLLFVHIYAENVFNNEGKTESLASSLNKSLSFSNVVNSRTEELERNMLLSLLNDSNLDLNSNFAFATIKAYANVITPILAFGFTDFLTSAIVFPIYRLNINVAFQETEEGKKLINELCKTSPTKCNEVAHNLNNSVDNKLKELGYEPLNSTSITELGDLMFIEKLRLFSDDLSSFGLKATLSIPTGKTANPNKLIDAATGDGIYKSELLALYNFEFIKNTFFDIYAQTTFHFPGTQEKRLPRKSGEFLSPDKYLLYKGFSYLYGTGFTLSHKLNKLGLTISTTYTFQHQTKNIYSSNVPEINSRCTYLEELESAQTLHSFTLGLQFSTVEWYLKKDFPLPFQFSFIYSHPFYGKNAYSADVFSAEMVTFF